MTRTQGAYLIPLLGGVSSGGNVAPANTLLVSERSLRIGRRVEAAACRALGARRATRRLPMWVLRTLRSAGRRRRSRSGCVRRGPNNTRPTPARIRGNAMRAGPVRTSDPRVTPSTTATIGLA